MISIASGSVLLSDSALAHMLLSPLFVSFLSELSLKLTSLIFFTLLFVSDVDEFFALFSFSLFNDEDTLSELDDDDDNDDGVNEADDDDDAEELSFIVFFLKSTQLEGGGFNLSPPGDGRLDKLTKFPDDLLKISNEILR